MPALLFAACVYAQPSMPAWLEPYPDAAPQTQRFKALVMTTYITPAAPAAVSEHYRKLFEAQSLPFQPNGDGIGAVLRASAECDLLLTIHPEGSGTAVTVNCTAKSALSGATARVASSPAQDLMERHQQRVADLGIHRQYEDAPAPPLIWPDWLVHVQGGRLSPIRKQDQSHRDTLTATYKTSAPMTRIFEFYKQLVEAHGYPMHTGGISTGQTFSGVTQNASGSVEGTNYPNGHPGPRTEIDIRFSRFILNEPITVRITFTPYDFKAPKLR